jgi:putative N6-adenine-specific DNA methylase
MIIYNIRKTLKMMLMFEMVAKTLFGLENILAEELRGIGAENIRVLNRAVAFMGSKKLMYKANYSLRTALKILVPLSETEINTEKDLYNFIRSLQWDKYLEKDDTLAVEIALKSNLFTHSQFVAQRIKDAIVDQFRDKYGQRPSVDLDNPVLRINAFIHDKTVKLSLDSSGDPLYKRGYRIRQGSAPLNEILAAGLILLTGWNSKIPFVDFMCGSGTLPVEAALIACKIPPGAMGRFYGFKNWKDYDSGLFNEVVHEKSTYTDFADLKILASDISSDAVRLAIKHAQNAGVADKINFQTCHFDDILPPSAPGIVIINPPYGERIIPHDINDLYARIGNKLKKGFAGYEAWIFSGNGDALKHVGLRPSKKINLFNGQLECKFHRYSLYEGSIKV